MTQKHLRLLFYALIFTLIFEGITRKLLPISLGKFMILLKDVILCFAIVGVVTTRISGSLKLIRNIFIIFTLLLSPLLVYTALKDPILAVFGAKQYLLYPFALFTFVLGFQNYKTRNFVMPVRWMTVLLLPLSALAVIQIFLPDSHWLNLSVTGTDLSAFKAGGRLRVSSTFPFVAQFCWYLPFLLPGLWATTTLKKSTDSKHIFKRLESLYILIPFFIVANVITGSRLAVVTNVMVIVFSAGLLIIRGKTQNIGRLSLFIFGIFISVFIARWIVPEAFEAYEARTGENVVVDEAEMTKRADHILTGWWEIYKYQKPGTFGFGIGVMSNGVQAFSPYAARIRDRVWGETDLANTVLEGGLYFVIIWMATRVLIIITCFRIYLSVEHSKLIYVASFIMGYILFNGLTQTLGIQPPLAIWWWIAIGLLIHVKRFEVFQQKLAKAKLKQKAKAAAVIASSGPDLEPPQDDSTPPKPPPPPPKNKPTRPLK